VLDRYASDALKAKYLAPVAAMDLLASYCLTEPGSGSDAASLSTSAVASADGWTLSGSKAFISGGA